jgi:hypothetical protein
MEFQRCQQGAIVAGFHEVPMRPGFFVFWKGAGQCHFMFFEVESSL